MATIDVKDAAGSTVALEKPLTPGSALSAASRPVVIASDQAAVAVKAASAAIASGALASGSIASGAVASGAVASGAVASGAVASGAFASGSIADGAMVTLGAKADAKSAATDTTAITLMQIAKQLSAYLALLVFGGGTQAAAQRVTMATDSPGIIATGSQASPSASYLSSVVAGDIANDGVDSGNPVKVGSKAIAGQSTATLVSAADRVEQYAGLDGVQLVRPHCGLEDIVSGVLANTDGASTSVIAAQGAGIRTYITTVILANTSATAVTVDLRDGAAGSVKATFPVPASTSGVVCNLPVPLGFTANTAVCMDGSAAASTVTCTLIGFKSKV